MQPIEKIKLVISEIKTVNKATRTYPGLSRKEIIETFKSIEIEPSQEVIELYELFNGITSLNGYFDFQEVEEVIEWYRTYVEIKEDNPDFKFQKSWIPLFSMNGDVILCLDCELFSVIAIDLELCRVEKIAQHYEDYLDAILDIFEQQAVIYEEKTMHFTVESSVWEKTCSKYQLKNPWYSSSK